jgi:hypothetical protein
MPSRQLRNPTNPADLALFVRLLERYANGAAERTSLDDGIADALGADAKTKAVASRLVQNFKGIPRLRREMAFGELADLSPQRSIAELEQGAKQLRRPIALRRALDDVSPPPVPPARIGDKITIKYTGLYCHEETDWDRGSNSDEPYLMTTFVHVSQDGKNITRTGTHPVGQTCYEGVDTGNCREGPVAACWSGTPQEVSVAAVLMEHDEGDPEAYRDEFELIVKAAVAYAKSQGIPVPEWAEELIVEGLVWLFGTGDDVIDTQYRVFSEEMLRRLASQSTSVIREKRKIFMWGTGLVEKEVVTTVPAHFELDFSGSGARYFAGFKVELQRGAFPAPTIPVDRLTGVTAGGGGTTS